MTSLQDRFSNIKDAMVKEGIEIICVVTPLNQPLLIIIKGMIIIGHTKDITDDNGDTVHYWERVYPDVKSILNRGLGIESQQNIIFYPPLLSHRDN